MAETFVQGGQTGGPGNIAGFTDSSNFFKQKVTLSPQATDTDPLIGSPTPAGGIRTGISRFFPTSLLTRPANTIAYGANTLVANSTSAGSVVVPNFSAAQANGAPGVVRRLRIQTNANSGMDGVVFRVDLWNGPALTNGPTFNVGDGGFYGLNPSTGVSGVATGTTSWIGSFVFTPMRQLGDGGIAEAASEINTEANYACTASSTLLYWTLQTTSVFTPISGQTFTLVTDLVED